MNPNLIAAPAPFPLGYTPIAAAGERGFDTGIDFGILRLAAGERLGLVLERETAFLLLDGTAAMHAGQASAEASRSSLFDDAPTALHAPGGAVVSVQAVTACELALSATDNDRAFEPRIFDRSTMVQNELRGKGMLGDAAFRVVRTIFDKRNRADANLVLGEAVTLPGRWSSYPPHHHPQPEIYHYRFAHASGFGFGEVGEDVVRLRHASTLKIPPGADHSQVSAPGYAMYYLWVIRHLPGNPYLAPEFTAAHRWLQEPGLQVWHPKEDAR